MSDRSPTPARTATTRSPTAGTTPTGWWPGAVWKTTSAWPSATGTVSCGPGPTSSARGHWTGRGMLKASNRWMRRVRRWPRPSSSSPSSALRSSPSTTGISLRTAALSRSPAPDSTPWSTRRSRTWSGPGCACCGERPTSSATRATRRARPPTRTRRSSRSPLPRSVTCWRRPTGWAGPTTSCGAGVRATTRC